MNETKVCRICGQSHVCEHRAGAKQTTRLVKCVCPDCGYTIRVTRKWLDTGLPYCACQTRFVEAGGK